MCGIVGFLHSSRLPDAFENIIFSMAEKIKHRGPDGEGYWHCKDNALALGHRRLSIHDLSESGHQPMISNSGRSIVVFNGEIYNYKLIRNQLEALGVRFKSDCDTEVLLEAIEFWGASVAVSHFNGMFSFAVWSLNDNTLSLFRDRMGEKPLYYSYDKDRFIFSSELKSLIVHPDIDEEVDRDVLALYLRYGHVPAPYSIYKGINKLEPGCGIVVKLNSDGGLFKSEITYWAPSDFLSNDEKTNFEPKQVVDQLEELLLDSVAKQMSADVPLGAFLSGGVDSSTVVALMQAQSASSVKTFSIGFNESGFNEATYAKEVADYLGTEHTELYVTQDMALDTLPKISTIYDEPFADSSQIPTYIVSELAKKNVTVSLSGDGGDELFFGYSRYETLFSRWQKISQIPFRKTLGGIIDSYSNFNSGSKPRMCYSGAAKMALWLKSKNCQDFYQYNLSHFINPDEFVVDSKEANYRLGMPNQNITNMTFPEHMAFADMTGYLANDILVKLDRASMATSLECRVPLLDHRLVEFSMKLPFSIKYKDGIAKWPLKQVLYRYLPEEMMNRPKMGFGIPIDTWLRSSLRDWVESLLSEERLINEGYLNVKNVRWLWQEHLCGKANHGSRLWNILMFQSWLENT